MTRRDPTLASRSCGFAIALGVAGLAAFVAPAAQAAICKYIDASGTIHYQNVPPDKSWRKLSCDIVEDEPRRSGGAKSATPANFPRVEPETQKSRDEMRRKVLTDELASEEKLLADARTAYGGGAPPAQADEKGDAEKYRQRVARLREAVQIHERNVEALRKEIAAIR